MQFMTVFQLIPSIGTRRKEVVVALPDIMTSIKKILLIVKTYGID